MKAKTFQLVLAILIIIGAIFYIESTKTKIVFDPKVEEISVSATTTMEKIDTGIIKEDRTKILKDKAGKYSGAIEIIPGGGFINTSPLKLKELIGKKVILLDFWTYSCINCLRTLPYLKSWYSKYKDAGLVIIGVHTPEFDFEKDYNNVSKAVKDLGVDYPVVQDNNYATWSAYSNRYWPHEYLIDIDGYIVHDHIGEGGYSETEKVIQEALNERAELLHSNKIGDIKIEKPNDAVDVSSGGVGSPENYFGSSRNQYFKNGTRGTVGEQNLKIPEEIDVNALYLGGRWNIQDQFATNVEDNAEIVFKYGAKNVYFVASSDLGDSVEVMVDGKKEPTIIVKENKLYNVVVGKDYGQHTLKLIIKKAGLKAFTFTFG